MSVLEKLLVPGVSGRIVDFGFDWLTGPVYRPEDHLGLTPLERVRALGLDGADGPFGDAPDHVDVVRFGTNPLMNLRIPTNEPGHGGVPWPTYPTGFLRDATPVWILTMTRMPFSARFVRIGLDGRGHEFSRYDGAARGWRGAKGYFPPLHLIGPRAKYAGLDLPCTYTADQQSVELVWTGDEQVPQGFEQVRPMVHARVVPVAECEVFDIALMARWRGQRVRIVQAAGEEALVVFTPDSAAAVEELGAMESEPGIYQVTVPVDELVDREGIRSDPEHRHRDPITGRMNFDDMTQEEIGEWAHRNWMEGLEAHKDDPLPEISRVKQNDYPHWKVVAYEFHTRPGDRVLVDRGDGVQVEGVLGGVRPGRGQDVLMVVLDGQEWACAREGGLQWSPKPNGRVRVETLTQPVSAWRTQGPGRPERWLLQTNMEGQP